MKFVLEKKGKNENVVFEVGFTLVVQRAVQVGSV